MRGEEKNKNKSKHETVQCKNEGGGAEYYVQILHTLEDS